jgi:UDP-GlcNAc:undecaprenyl-phosphate/decaprenyl-phosphate GlcNAc-1-phosphate transferase
MTIFFFLLITINFFLIIYKELIAKYLNIYDKPNYTLKKHQYAIPILGGLQIFINISIFFLYHTFIFKSLDFEFSKIYLTSAILFFIGLIDDKYSISPNLRLFLIILTITVFLFYENSYLINNIEFKSANFMLNISSVNIFFTTLCFALFINALNMFDGINLQSGLYGIVVCIFYLIIDTNNNLVIVIIISLLFHIYLNFKNESFLGDGGSYILGFLIAIVSIKLFNEKKIFSDEIFLIMAIPGYDMFRLFLIRVLKFKNPLKGDLNHIHHLIKYSSNETTALLVTFSLICIPLISVYYLHFNLSLILLLQFMLYVLVIFGFTIKLKKSEKNRYK